jgi:type IV pilus assembly protein PilE
MITDRDECRGFTLIEVMVVVVIIAILSAVALPAYKDYVIRAKITEAVSGLSANQTKIEQWYQDQHTYAGFDCTAVAGGSESFNFACSGTPDATTFTLTATGTGQMAGFVFTVDQSGAKKTTAVPAGWDLPGKDCWVTRKGGVC